MSVEKAMDIIIKSSGLDVDVKTCLQKNLEEINEIRRISQENLFTSCHEILNSKTGFLDDDNKKP
jgi:hypothetical protein